MRSYPNQTLRPQPSGFTLIELLIVLAIMAILASIAYPSYQQAMLAARRAEARTALTELLQQQERYYTQYGHYYLDQHIGPTPFKNYSGDSLESSAYLLSNKICPSALNGPTCVQVEATPRDFHDAEVGTLYILSLGPVRGCSGSQPERCWP